METKNIIMVPYNMNENGIYDFGTILRCTPDSGLGDKPFRLKKQDEDDVAGFFPASTPQHLYELSDEDIQENDYYILQYWLDDLTPINLIYKAQWVGIHHHVGNKDKIVFPVRDNYTDYKGITTSPYRCDFHKFNSIKISKIVATTDKSLGLPMIDDNTIDDYILSQQIIVKTIEPERVEFFAPNGESLGKLNEYEFLDLCVQIKRTKSSGYYYFEGETKKFINEFGRITTGRNIFTLHTELLKGLVGF